LAARLLEHFGDGGIVSYLASRYSAFIQIGDMREANRWMSFTLKVETLMGKPESELPQ